MNKPAQGRAAQINHLIKILEAQVNGSLNIIQAREAWERALVAHSPDVIAETMAAGMLNFQLKPGRIGVDTYPESREETTR